MSLYKLRDFIPNYQDYFDGDDIFKYDLYARNEKVGSIDDLLVDDKGDFRYFVINTGIWIFGKKVLLPVGRARIDYVNHQIHADTLTKEQVESLPDYKDEMTADFEHEERVRQIYRSPRQPQPAAVASGIGYAGAETAPAGMGIGYAGIETAPLSANTPPTVDVETDGYDGYDKTTYDYNHDAELYDLNEQNHGRLLTSQERMRLRRQNNQ